MTNFFKSVEQLIARAEQKPIEPQPDLCSCDTCDVTFKVSDCEADHGHHDGWEMPPYTQHLCPNCEDGVMEDYFYSNPGEIP